MVTATGPAPGSEMTTSAEPTEDRSTSGVLHVAAILAYGVAAEQAHRRVRRA